MKRFTIAELITMATRVYRRITRSLRKSIPEITPEIPPETSPEIQSEMAKALPFAEPVGDMVGPTGRKPRKMEIENGQFYFRDGILDQLDNYFFCLKRMKKEDPHAYDLFRQIGGHIASDRYVTRAEVFRSKRLTPWWSRTLPTFGAVAFAISPDVLEDEKKRNGTTPRLFYFQKLEPSKQFRKARLPPIPKGCALYLLSAYWDTALGEVDHKNSSMVTETWVLVQPDGTVKLLRTYQHHDNTVRAKRPHSGPHETRLKRGETFAIPQKQWCHSPILVEWAERHNEEVEQFHVGLFCYAALMYEASNYSMIRVDVANKDNLHAVFSVDIKRTPYFFKDRDATINQNGCRARIFHVVRPHARTSAGGQEKFVRMHFRGERKFQWNGYDVQITVPGKHHVDLIEFDGAAILATDQEKIVGEISYAKTGGMIREELDCSPLLSAAMTFKSNTLNPKGK